MCKKVNLNRKQKIFVHNYKLPSIQMRLKTFTERNQYVKYREFNDYF